MDRKQYHKKYHKTWYSIPENAAKQKANAKKHRLLQRERNKQFLLNYKSSLSCEKCGENHPSCLDFHHNNGNKFMDISNMVIKCYSLKKIEQEIKKCRVLCKNCHAKEHWK